MPEPMASEPAPRYPEVWWSPSEGFWTTSDGPIEGLVPLDAADDFRAYPPSDAVRLVLADPAQTKGPNKPTHPLPARSYQEVADILTNLSTQFIAARDRRKLSTRAVAEQLDVAPSTVSRLESAAEPSLGLAVRVLEWLGADCPACVADAHATGDPAQTTALPRLAELAEASGKARTTEWLRTCATLPMEEWPPAPAYRGPMVPAAEHEALQERYEALNLEIGVASGREWVRAERLSLMLRAMARKLVDSRKWTSGETPTIHRVFNELRREATAADDVTISAIRLMNRAGQERDQAIAERDERQARIDLALEWWRQERDADSHWPLSLEESAKVNSLRYRVYAALTGHPLAEQPLPAEPDDQHARAALAGDQPTEADFAPFADESQEIAEQTLPAAVEALEVTEGLTPDPQPVSPEFIDQLSRITAREPYTCPTLCDDDCESPCHEAHAIPRKRQHDVAECEARQPRDVGVGDDTSEPAVTPPDLSGRIVDDGPVQPFTAADHEETP